MDTVWVARARGAQASGPAHGIFPTRRRVAMWYGGFTVYAAALALLTGHADRAWAVWGAGAYALTTLLVLCTENWLIPLAVAFCGGLVAPLIWLATRGPGTAEVEVIGRSADLLLRHGSPYLPASQLSDWTSYNPYLPMMDVFGLPRSAGLRGLLGDPRVWLSITTIALMWVAFSIIASHRGRNCASCRTDVLRATTLAISSPVMAFPLALGITDPPVIALLCLTLACVWRGWLLRAGLALGAACATKATAWAAIPVLAAMIAVRYAPRLAGRFTAVAVAVTGALAIAAAPAAIAGPNAMLQNTVAFPLGLAKHKTPAASPLPGHLLAEAGPVGHWLAVTLMVLFAVGFAASLVLRPPRDVRGVGWRLAIGYAVAFALAPATRWGYFVYPVALLGWLSLTPVKDSEPNENERAGSPPNEPATA